MATKCVPIYCLLFHAEPHLYGPQKLQILQIWGKHSVVAYAVSCSYDRPMVYGLFHAPVKCKMWSFCATGNIIDWPIDCYSDLITVVIFTPNFRILALVAKLAVDCLRKSYGRVKMVRISCITVASLIEIELCTLVGGEEVRIFCVCVVVGPQLIMLLVSAPNNVIVGKQMTFQSTVRDFSSRF